MDTESWLNALQWRYATKQFDSSKTIDAKTWESIEDSLVLTPSSFGLQPWKFIVVTDPATKRALLPHSWGQPQVVDCSHLIVLAAKSDMGENDIQKLIDSTHSARGGDKDKLTPYKELMSGFMERMNEEQKTTWAKNQVYIAIGQLMATAAALGIDACPMEGISPSDFDDILKLKGSGYTTTLACPLGYRSADDPYATAAKIRYPKADIISHI